MYSAAKNKVIREKNVLTKYMKQLSLQTMLWPGLLCLLVFSYLPMFGIVTAFQRYSIYVPGLNGFIKAPWVGLKHFREFLSNEYFLEALTNTLGINLINLVIGFPIPIIFALMLNELISTRFKRIVQTVSYLPHFISWVVFSGLVMSMFSIETGVVNNILLKVGVIREPVFFLGKPDLFWPLVVAVGLFKELGWSAIIYLAAISTVDNEMHEAAKNDGANRFRRIWSVTLPSITGVIAILLILRVSGLLNSGFEQIYTLQNPLNIEASEVIDTYVYKVGIREQRFSYSAAVGLMKSVVAFILLQSANFMAKRALDESLF